MNYNFDLPTDRRGTYSLKWDVAANELPMWVADMEFATAPEIIEELHKRLDRRIFGYTGVYDHDYYNSFLKKNESTIFAKQSILSLTLF